MPRQLGFNDALKKAATNKQFAMDLIMYPEQHKKDFNLTDAQVAKFKEIASKPLKDIIKKPTREVY